MARKRNRPTKPPAKTSPNRLIASAPPAKANGLTFENLVLSIRGIDADLAAQAGRAVNLSLTTMVEGYQALYDYLTLGVPLLAKGRA